MVKSLWIKTGSNILVVADDKDNEYIKMSYREDNLEPAHCLLMDGRSHPVRYKCITFNLIAMIYIYTHIHPCFSPSAYFFMYSAENFTKIQINLN